VLDREELLSDPAKLELWVARRESRPVADHLLVLVHGLPRVYGTGRQAAGLLPELAEHVARESGWVVATGTMSGIGRSTGTFSVTQWRRDLAAIVDRLSPEASWVAMAGFGLGGAISLERAATDDRIKAVAVLATPADPDHWCGDAVETHRRVVAADMVDPAYPLLNPAALAADIGSLDPVGAAAKIPPKRFLIVHGSEDTEVAVAEARELFEAADGHAELRVIQGIGHFLRSDPRMVATLLGWLERQR
jgi:uncharacterized protein